MPLSQIETDSLSSALVAPTATALTTASGSAPSYSARAWVNFNGGGTVAIRASGNVSSVTDNGVGNYSVNYTTAMPDANYTGVATAGGGLPNTGFGWPSIGVTYTTSSCQFTFSNMGTGGSTYTGIDCTYVNIVVFR